MQYCTVPQPLELYRCACKFLWMSLLFIPALLNLLTWPECVTDIWNNRLVQGRSVSQELEGINKRHNAKNRLIIYNIMLLLLLYSSWFTEHEQELTRVVWKRLFSNKTKKENDEILAQVTSLTFLGTLINTRKFSCGENVSRFYASRLDSFLSP